MISRSSLLARFTQGRGGVRLRATEPKLFDFDALAQGVAGGMPRREVLRRLGQGIAATLLASLSLERAWGLGNSDCAHFCNSILPPGPARDLCKSAAARQSGLCYQCGPAAPAGHGPVCGTPTNRFCCRGDQVCVQGQCVCPSGYNECNGQCCPPGQYCCGSGCSVCPCDQTYCTGTQGERCCVAGEICCDGECCDGSVLACISGSCTPCPGGEAPCGDRCCPEVTFCRNIDPNTGVGACQCDTARYYFSCGATCCHGPFSEACVNGSCTSCPSGQAPCADRCCPENAVCRQVMFTSGTAVGTCKCSYMSCGAACCESFLSHACIDGSCTTCPGGQTPCGDRCCPEGTVCYVIVDADLVGVGECRAA